MFCIQTFYLFIFFIFAPPYICLFKENVKYAVRLRNYGSRTANGDGGITTVQCSDGVTFTFSTCSLSSNGTNQTRGQIPQVLYYRFDISAFYPTFCVQAVLLFKQLI